MQEPTYDEEFFFNLDGSRFGVYNVKETKRREQKPHYDTARVSDENRFSTDIN